MSKMKFAVCVASVALVAMSARAGFEGKTLARLPGEQWYGAETVLGDYERISPPSDSRVQTEAMGLGTPLVWDFTQGVPADGQLQQGAVCDASGLTSTQIEAQGRGKPSGFQLKKLFTPKGGFLFEATFVAGQPRSGDGLLWDDMAVNYEPKATRRGFQLLFRQRGNRWTPVFYGGFSNETCQVEGPRVKLAPGTTVSLAFLYRGDGSVVWEFAGAKKTSDLGRSGALAPSIRIKPTIGERGTSLYHPFNGAIQRVALTPCRLEPMIVRTSGRKAFVRGETASVVLEVSSVDDLRLDAGEIVAEQFGAERLVKKTQQTLGAVEPGEAKTVDVPLETRVRPGWHTLRVTVRGRRGDGSPVKTVRLLRYGIGPRKADRMTALMWGFDAPVSVLKDFGFTHGLSYDVSGSAGEALLDEALVAGVDLARSMRLAWPDEEKKDGFVRKDRQGVARTHGKYKKLAPEVSNPVFRETMRAAVAKDVARLGSHPAYAGVLPCSELRDGTFPSFVTECARYTAETGRAVPAEVDGKTWKLKKAERQFPTGVVPTDDPILSFYRWFWKGGDGWPALTGAVAADYRQALGGKGFTTFWDPAVRCPPIWGSGGAVDLINQWVYAIPEAMNVAGPAEEMLAMGAGRPGQRVSIMTQLICYRAQIAPMDRQVEPSPAWVARRPKADFPTIPPDTLQEATWSMIAKPVTAIMYHGWGTIYETGAETGYVYTNPESAARLRALLTGVVAPLGPTLRRLGRTPPPVAVLESFTTCALGGPASWGWKVPAVTFLQRARLDPRVVYEETILRDGLADVKVLYAPQCRFLTPPVIEKIRAFQAQGGILVADAELVSVLKPDVTVPVVSFDRPPESDHTEDVNDLEASREGDAKTRAGTLRAKAKMVAQAEKLRADLAARYVPAVDSSSAELVVYSRRGRETDYVFAINDRRTFGDYVGPWGLTMEKGLPLDGRVTVADPARRIGAVYELSRGGRVAFTREGEKVCVPVSYATNDGRLFVFLRAPIASVDATVPSAVAAGESLEVRMTVADETGKPVPALLPVEIRVYDAAGRELDGAGFLTTENGVASVRVQTNVDDAPGGYRVVCRDRASGLKIEKQIAR